MVVGQEGREESRGRIDQRLIRFGFTSSRPAQANKRGREGRRHDRNSWSNPQRRQILCIFSVFPPLRHITLYSPESDSWQLIPCISHLPRSFECFACSCAGSDIHEPRVRVCTGYFFGCTVNARKFVLIPGQSTFGHSVIFIAGLTRTMR